MKSTTFWKRSGVVLSLAGAAMLSLALPAGAQSTTPAAPPSTTKSATPSTPPSTAPMTAPARKSGDDDAAEFAKLGLVHDQPIVINVGKSDGSLLFALCRPRN